VKAYLRSPKSKPIRSLIQKPSSNTLNIKSFSKSTTTKTLALSFSINLLNLPKRPRLTKNQKRKRKKKLNKKLRMPTNWMSSSLMESIALANTNLPKI